MYRSRFLLACALALLLVSIPALGQNRSGDRWVASWATALVARAQGQGTFGGRGQGPAQPAAQPVAAAAPVAAPVAPRQRRRTGTTSRWTRRVPATGHDHQPDDQAGRSCHRGRRSVTRRAEQRVRDGTD